MEYHFDGSSLPRKFSDLSADGARQPRYVGNSPTNYFDPTGLIPEGKDASDASKDAKALEAVIPQFLDQFKEAAKNTDKVERGGQIVKDIKSGKYSLIEQKGKATSGTHTRLKDPAAKQERGANPPECDKNGVVDLTQKTIKLDRGKVIDFGWHTHPHPSPDFNNPGGDPWPSSADGKASKDNNLPELIIQAQKNTDGTWDYHFHISDTDGKYYEYRPR